MELFVHVARNGGASMPQRTEEVADLTPPAPETLQPFENIDSVTNAPASDNPVARRAYQRFEERGREHGRDLEDWFEAEREIRTPPTD